jgi:alkylhydroperoxidase family enzyme
VILEQFARAAARLYELIEAWRQSPFFKERERAALAWTDAVTRIAGRVKTRL